MKPSILLFAAMLVAISAQATVRTVSNSPSQPAQYSSLQVAIDAAVNGDTLYVLGTGTAYPAITIDKQLTIIGSGYAPPAPAQPTVISTIYLYSNAGGSKLSSIDANSTIYIYCSDVTLERSRIYSIAPQVAGLNNLVFRHNYVYYASFNNANSVLFANNIVHTGGYIQTSNSASVLITNNLFISYYWHALNTISNALVTNNIFWQSLPGDASVVGCTYNNNISYQTANDNIPFGTNGGSGNLVGVNPQFTNAPNNTLNFAYNYDLLAGSAGNNAGTDGTDIGIYGGPAPWPNQNGVARIPRVREFNLQFSQVPQGGTVNATVKANKEN